MDGLVVSLDPDLDTLKRVWVVAEIAEAMKEKPVHFRLAGSLGYKPMQNLRQGEPLLPHVQDCESTSPDDKAAILKKVDDIDGLCGCGLLHWVDLERCTWLVYTLKALISVPERF